MALTEKYAALIALGNTLGIADMQAREQDNVLYIDGTAPTGEAKDKMWEQYNAIDPDFRAADVVMNLNVSTDAPFTRMKVTTESSNLNIRKGPGTDQEIIGKAAHHSVVTFLSKYNDEWALIRTDDGEEGYCATDYLTAEA